MACKGLVVADCIQHSLPKDADTCFVGQEMPRLLWNLNIHCCVHNSPTLDPILSHLNPVHTLISYFWRIHFNINLSFTLRFYKFLPIWFFVFNCVYNFIYPCVLHVLPISSLIWSPKWYLVKRKVIKFLIMKSSPELCYFLSLKSKYSLFSDTLSLFPLSYSTGKQVKLWFCIMQSLCF
jgi:hypothetical protein